MLEFQSGSSTAVNSTKAMQESLDSALGEDKAQARLVILHSTMGHNFSQLLKAGQGGHAPMPKSAAVPVAGSPAARALAKSSVRWPF